MPTSRSMFQQESTLAADLIAYEDQYGAHNYHPLDVVIERAAGAWVCDVDGNRYLDFLAAYSAVNQGHCHPAILQAFYEQATKVTLTSRAFRNDQLPLLLKDLHDLTGFDMALPMNSGAEAVETALKAARKWGYTVKGIPADQAEIIVASNNFHGRTITIVGFSSESSTATASAPSPPASNTSPTATPRPSAPPSRPTPAPSSSSPSRAKPASSIPPAGYLEQVAAICRENNVLLMLDEIQSGLGRTGKLFAYQHEDITPDVVIIGKALAGGFYPVSAVLASATSSASSPPATTAAPSVATHWPAPSPAPPSKSSSTRTSAPAPPNSAHYALTRLQQLRSPLIKEVRGKGLWIAIELNVPARPLCEALKDRGLLCKETHDTVIRLAPPLIIEEADLNWALDQIEAVIATYSA